MQLCFTRSCCTTKRAVGGEQYSVPRSNLQRGAVCGRAPSRGWERQGGAGQEARGRQRQVNNGASHIGASVT